MISFADDVNNSCEMPCDHEKQIIIRIRSKNCLFTVLNNYRMPLTVSNILLKLINIFEFIVNILNINNK